jgi:hypothetical protein
MYRKIQLIRLTWDPKGAKLSNILDYQTMHFDLRHIKYQQQEKDKPDLCCYRSRLCYCSCTWAA